MLKRIQMLKVLINLLVGFEKKNTKTWFITFSDPHSVNIPPRSVLSY